MLFIIDGQVEVSNKKHKELLCLFFVLHISHLWLNIVCDIQGGTAQSKVYIKICSFCAQIKLPHG